MSYCYTCGAPVSLAPDGDPRYEKQPCPDCAALRQQLADAQAENAKLRDAIAAAITGLRSEGYHEGNPVLDLLQEARDV